MVPGSAHARSRPPGAQLGAADSGGWPRTRARRAGGAARAPQTPIRRGRPRGRDGRWGLRHRARPATRDQREKNARWARLGPRVTSGRVGRARKRGGARERGTEPGGEARGGGDGGGARPVPVPGGGRGPRGLERANGALPSSGSRPPRRANAGMASGARGPQAAPAQPCDAALRGAPRAAGGSLKDARHRPQIPSDWCKVERGGASLSPPAGAVPGRRCLAQRCGRAHVPAVVRSPRSAAPGAPQLWRGRLGAVPPGRSQGLGGPRPGRRHDLSCLLPHPPRRESRNPLDERGDN